MRRRSASGRMTRLRAHAGSLTLTSMMDILTVLLIFILKSYVSGGDVVTPPPGLNLPKSTAEENTPPSLVIAIDHDDILVGSDRVASVAAAINNRELSIAPLAERLQQEHEHIEELARHQAGGSTKAHVVTIQGDKDIEFRVLQKVMYTVQQSGFPDIALAVLKKS